MFWKKASEWASVMPNSPSAIRFGVVASQGFEKLVILPNDPASKAFLNSVERLTNEACHSDGIRAEFSKIADDLNTLIAKFARSQRNAVEDSIGEVYEGLREVLQSLEGAISSSETLETTTEGVSSRLLDLQRAKSYEEVVTGIKKEISTLNRAVSRHRDDAKMIRQVAAQHVDVLRTKLRTAEKAVRTDHLTKLGNRSSFDMLVTTALSRVEKGEVYGLALLDVDRFKSINDTYGHLVGDAALVEFAKQLSETFALPGTSVIRYGGDEFAVLYRGSIIQLEAKLERVNNVLAKSSLSHGGKKIYLHASYGLVALRAGHTLQKAVDEADRAMYISKSENRRSAA
jgi:diguanylate cyclase (GGDEF)-like protein